MSEPSSHSSSHGESLMQYYVISMMHTGYNNIVHLLCNTLQRLFPITEKMADLSAREELDDACLRDSISIASTDSFVSAAEVREALTIMLCITTG